MQPSLPLDSCCCMQAGVHNISRCKWVDHAHRHHRQVSLAMMRPCAGTQGFRPQLIGGQYVCHACSRTCLSSSSTKTRDFYYTSASMMCSAIFELMCNIQVETSLLMYIKVGCTCDHATQPLKVPQALQPIETPHPDQFAGNFHRAWALCNAT